MGTRQHQVRQPSDNTADFRRIFLRRVHQLIRLGYERMTPASLQDEEETAITQDLAACIRGVLDEVVKVWMRHYFVQDEVPVSDIGRKGKHRPRVDIRIDSAEVRPRTRFSFEAKRLGKNHTVGVYLGENGLGCFLRGDYARDEAQAGMLGYVQSGQPADWAEVIRGRLSESPEQYGVRQGTDFAPVDLQCGLDHTYRSDHDRPAIGTPISIFHTLLSFN